MSKARVYSSQRLRGLSRPSCQMHIPILQPHLNPTQHAKLGHLSMLLCCVFSHSVVSNSLQPHELQPARSLWSWDFFQARILEWVAISSSKESFYPVIGFRSPMSLALQEDSLPIEPSRKPWPRLNPLPTSLAGLMSASHESMVYKTQETLEDKPSSWTRKLKHLSLRKLRTMILKQQFL